MCHSLSVVYAPIHGLCAISPGSFQISPEYVLINAYSTHMRFLWLLQSGSNFLILLQRGSSIHGAACARAPGSLREADSRGAVARRSRQWWFPSRWYGTLVAPLNKDTGKGDSDRPRVKESIAEGIGRAECGNASDVGRLCQEPDFP